MTRDRAPLDIGALKPPGLWQLDPDDYAGAQRYLIRALQLATLVIRDFWRDQCVLHAAALAFTTILSLVPFFALAFALLKGFGVQNRLEPLILEQVTAGSQKTVSQIITYINNTNVNSLGAIGLVLLVITVLSLLASIEEAFNAIWGVCGERPVSRKLIAYLGITASTPFLLFAAVSITTFLENQAVITGLMDQESPSGRLLGMLNAVPYVSTWAAFTLLYRVIPNTRVRPLSALFGGIIAGTAWQAAQWGYIHFQIGVGRYNAIYGTLSLLPIFMIWLYMSWVIVLFGVELAYAHQNRATLRLECHGESLSHAARLELALTLLVECSASFRDGIALNAEQFAATLSLPIRQVAAVLGDLERSALLIRLGEDSSGWHPSREPATILVRDVVKQLGATGGVCLTPHNEQSGAVIRAALNRAVSGSDAALEELTIGDLTRQLKEEQQRPGRAG